SPSFFALRLAVCGPAHGTHFPGPVPGVCCADPHSSRFPPFAPPAPPPADRLCSQASSLLWRNQTPHDRASSATVPHLPDADQHGKPCWPITRPPGSRARSVYACQGLRPRQVKRTLAITHPFILPST